MKNRIFKKLAIALSMVGVMAFSAQTANACSLTWCGSTITCDLTPCSFNVGGSFAIVTCGENVVFLECVPSGPGIE